MPRGGSGLNLGSWPNTPLRSAATTAARFPQKIRKWLDSLSNEERGRMPPEPSHVLKSKYDYKALLSAFLYNANDEARTKFFSDPAFHRLIGEYIGPQQWESLTANVTAIHKERENATKLNRTRARQQNSDEVEQVSDEVEQVSDEAGSDDSEETESDEEAAGKDEAAAEDSGGGVEDSDTEHERGKRSVSTTSTAGAGGETQDMLQNTLWQNEKPRTGSKPIAEETPLGEKEADKATNKEPEGLLRLVAVQSDPSHAVETSASSAFANLSTTPHRLQITKPSFKASPFRGKRSYETDLEGNASIPGETTAAPQPKRWKTIAGKSVPGYASSASMSATVEDVEGVDDVATAVTDKPLTTLSSLRYEPMKETAPFVESDIAQLQETDKGLEYNAFLAQEGGFRPRIGQKSDSPTSEDRQRKSTQELNDDYQSSGPQTKKLTDLGTARYPDVQNEYGITLADVIELRGNSRDKGAYEAYKAVLEVMPSLQVERLLPRILDFGDAVQARDRAAKHATAKKCTAPLARLAQAFGADKVDMLQQVHQHVAQMRIALDVKNRVAISGEEKAAIGGASVGRDVTTEYYDMLSHYEVDGVLSPEDWANRRSSPECLGERKEWSRKRAAGERIAPFVEICPGLLFLLPDWMSPKSLRAKSDIWAALLGRAMKGYEQYELLLKLGQIFNPWVEALKEDRLASWEVFGGQTCFYKSCVAFTKNESLFSTFSGKQKTDPQEEVYMTALDSELDKIILDMSPFPDAGHTFQLGEFKVGIGKSDMERLKQGGWLSDNVVNGLIGLTINSPEAQTTEKQNSYALIESMKWHSDRTYNRTTEVAYNRRTLIPICISQHWMLLLVVPPEGSVWLFDSLATARSTRLQGISELIKDAFKVVDHDNITLSLKQAETAYQTNGNDCGAHVVVNAAALSQGDQPAREIETLDIPRDRLSMGQMIARRYWEQRFAAKLAETETTSRSKPPGTRTHGERDNTAPAASSSNDAALSPNASTSDGKPVISNETFMSPPTVSSPKDIGSAKSSH